MMIFVDPFSLYDSPTLMAKSWDVLATIVQSGVTRTQSTTSGRFGGGGVAFVGPTSAFNTASTGGSYIQKNYSGRGVVIVGLAIKQTNTQVVNGARLLTLLDGATTQVGIDIMPSGQLRAIRSTNVGTGIFIGLIPFIEQYMVLGMSTNAITSSSFDFLELKITHGTLGSIEVKRNGESFWLLENVNTARSGSNNSSSLLVGGYGVNGTGANSTSTENHHLNAIISDFHLLDTVAEGSDPLNPVDFIGDRRWQPRLPSSDGFHKEWTPNPGPNHFANVNEIPPNSGTTENNTETVGARDTFNCDDATGPTTASVILAHTMFLEKNAGGSVGISGIFRLSGADRNGTEFQATNPYAYRQSFLASKPGGGAITIADVNAGEHGYERTS